MQKQWKVDAMRRTNESANSGWDTNEIAWNKPWTTEWMNMNRWIIDSMNAWALNYGPNETMNRWTNESVSQRVTANQWINGSVTLNEQWTKDAKNQWIKESSKQWTNESTNEQWIKHWVNDSGNQWVNEPITESMNRKSVSQRISESMFQQNQ